ncbi:MAG: CopG family transcriptional regulator [Janthinobacterium lividum]
MTRTRLNIYLEPEHARRLEQVAAMKGVSKSSILAAALASWLLPEGGDQREAVLMRRLDRLSRQFDGLERDQHILIETIGLFVRYFLTVSIPVPESHQDAARAQGRARYAQFVEHLVRQLARGPGLATSVREEVYPQPSKPSTRDQTTDSSHESAQGDAA